MFENLSVFENRYEELNMKLYDPAVAADRNLYRDLMKEHKEIEPIVEKYRALKKAEASLEDAEAILNDSEADKELRQMASDEMSAAKSDIESISEELKILLLPRDPTTKTTAVLSWKFAAAQAARKRHCSPITFTACTTCTPKSAAGKRRSSA